MKKLGSIALSLLLCSCHHGAVYETEEVATYHEEEEVVAVFDNNMVTVTEVEDKIVISKRAVEVEAVKVANQLNVHEEPAEEVEYDSAYDRFLHNVIIKKKSPNWITYEYKDVRVDELAPLASRYCEESGGNRTAILRGIQLYKNYSRWATFDCVNLQ